ncbi:hypothetical protein LQL77_31425 [Rhodococcus cerastii]|nr:hypothetical protein [Rhodococcus cerastii]
MIDHPRDRLGNGDAAGEELGITSWNTLLQADRWEISGSTDADAWCKYGVQPWRNASVMFSPIVFVVIMCVAGRVGGASL